MMESIVMTVRFDYDISVEEAQAAYKIMTAALAERRLRFAADLSVVRSPSVDRVLNSMNTLWSGGDLGG